MSSVLNLLSKVQNFSFFTPSEDPVIKEMPPFGEEQWEKFLNLKVDAPPLSEKIVDLLEKPCPFWSHKLIKETHMLCLIPAHLNLEKLYALISYKTNSPFLKQATYSAPIPYWILITKKTIPCIADLSFEVQKEKLSQIEYAVPHALEAAIAILGAKYLSNVSLYSELKQFTRCNEEVDDWPVAIGSDLSAPCCIYTNDWNAVNSIAGVRRFDL